MDGTDFHCNERRPFWNGNFSHKFNHSGVRYEVITDAEGNIVRLDGPHRGGIPDTTNFRRGAMKELAPGEVCCGDKLYKRNLAEVFLQTMTKLMNGYRL